MQTIFSEAVQRLANFRAGWEDNDEIDEVSGLTATDLDLILAQLYLVRVSAVTRELRDDKPQQFERLLRPGL